jgi:hypothetical protein
MSASGARIVALTLLALSLALGVAGVVFAALNGRDPSIILPIVGFASVGALLASRRPGNPIGWIFSAAGLGIALAWFAAEYATRALVEQPGSLPGGLWLAWLSDWLFAPAFYFAGVLLLLLFPTGRPLSPRWRYVVWATAVVAALLAAALSLLPKFFSPPFDSFENPVGVDLGGLFEGLAAAMWLASLVSFVLASAALIVRFRRSGGIERQQIKWVTAVGVVALAAQLASNLAYDEGIAEDVTAVIAFVGVSAIPVATGIAIFKYHLYDIDLIIRRTLVYGVLSALLAGLYFAIVLALQAAFSSFTGGSDLAIAVSTLAVAALFRPARRRIQGIVDRRFYRRKYDAQRTLEAFGTRLRDEIDLEALSVELRQVVNETMQPAHVSLWLREAEER